MSVQSRNTACHYMNAKYRILSAVRLPYRDPSQLLMRLLRILPGAGQHAIVPIDGVRIIAKFALFHVLLDWVVLLFLHPN